MTDGELWGLTEWNVHRLSTSQPGSTTRLSAEWILVMITLGVSVLTLFSMIKIWNEAFWKESPSGDVETVPSKVARGSNLFLVGPPLLLATLTLMMGLAAGPVYELASKAAEQLMSPQLYITAVLGGAP